MSKEEQFQAVLNCLNAAVASDPVAIENVLEHRVHCNRDLVAHPSIVVANDETVGALGLINGVLVAAGLPKVAASFNEVWRLEGFVAYKPKEG